MSNFNQEKDGGVSVHSSSKFPCVYFKWYTKEFIANGGTTIEILTSSHLQLRTEKVVRFQRALKISFILSYIFRTIEFVKLGALCHDIINPIFFPEWDCFTTFAMTF